MDLQTYFQRVDYHGKSRPTLAALSALQQSHVCSVPFENLDVQLGQSLTIDIDAAYEKIVVNGRGGWCYEQNGLFGWALSQIGFEVTRLSASVMRQRNGEASAASHLCLMVSIPDDRKQTYLVDVGFGGSMITPIELAESEFNQPPFRLGLRRLEDGHWRFWEDIGRGEFSYDFLVEVADESALSKKCSHLQRDPTSSFVLDLVVRLRLPEQHKALRGRILKIATATGISKKTLQSSSELVETLKTEFRLDVPEVNDLWPRVVARHEEFLRAKEE
jgi:N-hydroxyarylamine O-acetyltransferase